ncbi:PREDICTED: myosin-binding protein 2 [Tarenaya hassleriana]|uniref:myosin-binding protein 2 n=1 Tax=Tarenaya hassleriana TaxID=28532 RepID=UPI00053C1508|nr:PREDICTED: myosin-binding protein 2 [Tarenaya hassleriana]XP_010552697.1 PREDICTED: myosin-binding protein 2 [Tarenaya hassleriana]
MATNKFATLIHRKTNRFTLLLVYAFLEWTLIFFILLNSLFSFLILRFADFFGLQRPCLFCSTLDRFFHSSASSLSYRDLLCHDHSLQVSRIRFCPTHRRFAESGDFCEDCSSSTDLPEDLIERCPCCGASVENRASQPCPLIDPDSGILGFSDDGKPIGEEIPVGVEIPVEQIRSDFVCTEDSVRYSDSLERGFTREEESKEKLPSEDEKMKEDENSGNPTVHQATGEKDEVNDGGDENDGEEEFSRFISSFDCNKEPSSVKEEENEADLVMEVDIAQKTSVAELSTDKPTEASQKHLEFYIDGQDCHLIPVEFFRPGEEVREISDINGDVILDFDAEVNFSVENGGFSELRIAFAPQDESKPEDDSLAEDLVQMENDEEADGEVSIGTEIPDHEQMDEAPSHEITPDDDEDDCEQAEETLEFRTVAFETKRPLINVGIRLDEESHTETRGSADILHSPRHPQFHLDQRESGAEDSLDAENESPNGNLTIEKLKSVLWEERKALNALYAELEEERNASAIAANETMAMINRLQEEKAAMQMEALQYQRMMEEQSEYDQEALQLMNELMVKREKEKGELEKELELFRKRVEEFESNEKMGMLRRRGRRDLSVDSYKNGDLCENGGHDNDRTDENGDSDDRYGVIEIESTPADAVLCLEECSVDFERERLSILGRLKVLEEKLSTLNDEEDDGDEIFEDVKLVENGHVGENMHFHTKEVNGKHKVLKSKRLLPLFDAVEAEMENGLSNGNHHENGVDQSENGGIAIDEEIDELYERLEALEADREFVRHCVGSLRKGDKGVYLLQQILQHLRDLRNVELQERSSGDMVL